MENENVSFTDAFDNGVAEDNCQCFESECDVCEETAEPTETKKEKLLRKCNEVKACCCGTAGRIANDLKDCNYNPYFRETRSYRLEVYRNANDEEPIDEFEISDNKAFSARSLAIAGGVILTLAVAAKIFAGKLTN